MRPPSRRIAALLAVFAFCSLTLSVGTIAPDGIGDVSYLPSLFFDGDLLFWNEFQAGGIIAPTGIMVPGVTPTGGVWNHYTVGSAVLWSPFWLAGHLVTRAGNRLGQGWPEDGIHGVYNLSVRFGTFVLALCTLLIAVRFSAGYVSSRAARLAGALVALGTPFLWYTLKDADLSHIPAAFCVSLFLLLWDGGRRGAHRLADDFVLGLVGGLATIARPHDALVFLFPALSLGAEARAVGTPRVLRPAAAMATGALLPIGLQAAIWQVVYGTPLGPAAGGGVTSGFYHFFHQLRLFEVLFSSYHGLFFFAPVTAIAILGLLALARRDRLIACGALGVLAGQIALMATERWFWEGAAFGLRRLVDVTPIFVLGLAVSLDGARRRLASAIAASLVAWSLLLAWTYSLRPVSLLNEYQTPRQILALVLRSLEALPASLVTTFTPSLTLVGVSILACLAPLGYALVHVSARLSDTEDDAGRGRAIRMLGVALLVALVPFYLLTALAGSRSATAIARYRPQLEWLAAHSESARWDAQSVFLLQEGGYEALAHGWGAALPSFAEALRVSPDRAHTRQLLEGYLVRQHHADIAAYLAAVERAAGPSAR